MKCVLLSVKPKYVSKILNGEKTIEIRKKFPKDYVGWVYIYCCKQRKNEIGCHINYEKVDGKVVARFWCDKVEKINHWNTFLFSNKSCLKPEEIDKYLGDENYVIDFRDEDNTIGYAIHITNLEIFDKPKEISEFIVCLEKKHKCRQKFSDYSCKKCVSMNLLTRAPQSWQFIEV